MKDTNMVNIERICADKTSIHFYGKCYPEYVQRVKEWKVFETQPYTNKSITVDWISKDIYQDNGYFRLIINRYENSRDRLYSSFRVGIKEKDNDAIVFVKGPCYVTDFNDISMFCYDYPSSHTIKGLQVQMVDDAIKLGIGHAALNLNLPTIMLPYNPSDAIVYEMEGEEFYFDRKYMEQFDAKIKKLSDHGIVVYLILLNSIKWDGVCVHPELKDELIHPSYDKEGFISAFNVVTERGLKRYKAFIEFIAERYTRPDQKYGRACGFIIGNEVNSQWVWCNAGEKTVQEYVQEYSLALRTAFYAARKKYNNAKVYISLDHYWTLTHQNNPLRFYKGKDVVDILTRICQRDGNFDWGIAYHPYPENLFYPDFWNDTTAINSFNTGRITFKNIEVLPQYLSQDDFLYCGKIRSIILSEQGFHSDESEEGEKLQAAAFCLAYKKIASIPSIEAFILHSHVDNKDEFGLNLGLWRRNKNSKLPNAPGSPKLIYYVFRDIDKPNGEKVCEFVKEFVKNVHYTY